MTLASSGTLFLQGYGDDHDIQFECTGASTVEFSLTDAQTIASSYVGALPTDMLEFYGYNWGSRIFVDFSTSTTWTTDTDDDKDGWKWTEIYGWHSGDVISLDLHIAFTERVGPVICTVYKQTYFSSTWTSVASFSASGSGDYEMTGILYEQPPKFRIDISTVDGWGDVSVSLTGGTITTGSGEITIQGTTGWYVEVGDAP